MYSFLMGEFPTSPTLEGSVYRHAVAALSRQRVRSHSDFVRLCGLFGFGHVQKHAVHSINTRNVKRGRSDSLNGTQQQLSQQQPTV